MKASILNSIKKGIKEFKLSDKKYKNCSNNNNNYYIPPNTTPLNKKLFNGVKQYFTNVNENNNSNNNNNFTSLYQNNIDKKHANIIINNYKNIYMTNYMTLMNSKIYSYNSHVYKMSISNCLQKIKENEKYLENIKSQIKLLENQTLYDMVLFEQMQNLINYIKKKSNISNLDDNNDIKFSTNLKHPYFYTDHNEELRVKFILYLIEGLFLEEHLIKDYTLLNMINRDGYVSLTQLVKHPQLIFSKINLERLKPVFLEHRQNEITETVETFDDILIRNKDWKNIKKKYKFDVKKIEQNLLNEMGNIRHNKMQNLMGRKSEIAQIQDKLFFRYHVMTQQAKQIQNQFNTINNIYINQSNNFILNNNYNYNWYNNQRRFGY